MFDTCAPIDDNVDMRASKAFSIGYRHCTHTKLYIYVFAYIDISKYIHSHRPTHTETTLCRQPDIHMCTTSLMKTTLSSFIISKKKTCV